jgi:hypothetical protein
MATMSDSMFTTTLHGLLRPIRKKLHQTLIKNTFVNVINKMAFIVPVAAAIWLLCIVFISICGIHLDINLSWGLAIILGIAVLWPIIADLGALLSQPDWNIVTKYVDTATNNHNIVSIAYEHSLSDTPSLFAKIAIYRGVQMVDTFTQQIVKQEVNSFTTRHLVTGFVIAGILYAASFWIPKSGAQYDSDSGILASIKSALKSQQLSDASQKALQPPHRQTNTAKNTIEKRSYSQSALTNVQKSMPLPDISGTKSFGNDNTGGQSGKPSPTQSGSAASTQNNDKQKNTPDTTQKLRKDGKTGVFSAAEKTPENPSNAASKGMAGSSPNAESDIKASLVSGGLGETPDNDEADQDHPDRPQNSPASLGQRPELADKQVAPNRDLGMSGKPGDKAGDGRGGPGLIKKSRATASALSAMTIPVYIKGQIQPGKSKSYSQSLPLSAGQYQPPAFSAGNNQAQEGQMTLYTPDVRWKSVIETYFLNLRKLESK